MTFTNIIHIATLGFTDCTYYYHVLHKQLLLAHYSIGSRILSLSYYIQGVQVYHRHDKQIPEQKFLKFLIMYIIM